MTLSIFAIKHVCNIKKWLYKSIQNFNYINDLYIFEKVIETSILSAYYHTNLKGGAGRRMPRIRKKLFHAKYLKIRLLIVVLDLRS